MTIEQVHSHKVLRVADQWGGIDQIPPHCAQRERAPRYWGKRAAVEAGGLWDLLRDDVLSEEKRGSGCLFARLFCRWREARWVFEVRIKAGANEGAWNDEAWIQSHSSQVKLNHDVVHSSSHMVGGIGKELI
jgi:hypothetical protein